VERGEASRGLCAPHSQRVSGAPAAQRALSTVGARTMCRVLYDLCGGAGCGSVPPRTDPAQPLPPGTVPLLPIA
jgi:hypothetical protein